jgi:type VI secretion system protein ImpC
MSDAQKVQAQAQEQTLELGLLDQIVEQGKVGKDASAKERGKGLVKEFVSQILQGHMTLSRDAEATINARIAQIDHLLSLQLNEIMHHASFQQLEGSWRGLKYMMDQSETSDMLKIKVLNCSKKRALRNSTRAPFSRRSTRKNSAYSVVLPSLRSSAISTLGSILRTLSCWNAFQTSLPPLTLRSSPEPTPP